MPLLQSDNVDQAHFHEASLVYTDAAGKDQAIIFDAVVSEDWNPNAEVTEHPVEDGANIADHVRVGLMTCSLKVHVTVEPSGSNWMADPTNEFAVLTLAVPTWFSNLDLNTKILQAAGIASEVVAQGAAIIEDATPLGNLVAQALIPTRQVTATGNIVPGFDTSDALVVAGQAVTSLADVASNLTFAAVEAAQVPGFQAPVTVLANTVQWGPFTDFAAVMFATLNQLLSSAQLFTVLGSKNSQDNMVMTGCPSHRGDITETGTGIQFELQFKQVRIVSTNTVAAPIPDSVRAQNTVTKGQQDPSQDTVQGSKSVLAYLGDNGASALKSFFGAVSGAPQ